MASESLHNSERRDTELDSSARTAEWFSQELLGHEVERQPLSQLSLERLAAIAPGHDPQAVISRLTSVIRCLPEAMQEAAIYYVCGYPERNLRVLSDIAVADITAELSKHFEVIGTSDTIAVSALMSVAKKPRTSRRQQVETDAVQNEEVVEDKDEAQEHLIKTPLSSDSVADYFKSIAKFPLLDAEQEVELGKKIEAGVFARAALDKEFNYGIDDEATRLGLEFLAREGLRAYEKMINSNLRLVVSIAKRHTGRGLPFLDLIQHGNIGLMRAVQMFDYTKGYKFSTYGTWWIRQSITRSLADQGREIRVPVHTFEKLQQMSRIQASLFSELGRMPSDNEIASEMKIPAAKVSQLREVNNQTPVSIHLPIGDGDTELGDLIEDTEQIDPMSNVAAADTSNTLASVLSTLTDRERYVLSQRFGLSSGTPKTLDKVSDELGVTKERVRQIQDKALAKLRHPSRASRLRRVMNS